MLMDFVLLSGGMLAGVLCLLRVEDNSPAEQERGGDQQSGGAGVLRVALCGVFHAV